MNSFAESLYTEDLYRVTGAILVITSKDWKDLSEDEKNLLNKILNSVKLTPESVTMLSLSPVTLEKLQVYDPVKVISFGTPVYPQVKLYDNTSVNGISVLQADALDRLDDAKKKSLWLGLKQMFGI